MADLIRTNLDLLRTEFDVLRRRVTELERSKEELRDLFEDTQRRYMQELESVRKRQDEIDELLTQFAASLDGLTQP